jgi:HPt (histidine-containing phosphotransfer) domain-containing protein
MPYKTDEQGISMREMEQVMTNSGSTPETLQAPELTPAGTNWNLPELLERVDNDRAFLVELLNIFREDSRVAMEQAQEALSKQDLPALERKAHTLKGMLRNLLMGRAAQAASELEIAARQGSAQDCRALLAQVRAALDQLAPEVEAQMQR